MPSFASAVDLATVTSKRFAWPTRDLGWIDPPWSAESHYGPTAQVLTYAAECRHHLGKGFWVLVKDRQQVFGWCMADPPA